MANKDALRELQQRLAQRLQTVREQAPTRNWLAVEMAGHGFLLPLDQAGEIFPLSAVHAVPHSQPWFLGVANLRGQLHGVIDLAGFVGLPRDASRSTLRAQLAAPARDTREAREGARLVAFNGKLQVNAALFIDRLLGLRNANALQPAPTAEEAGKPHFIGQQMADAQGRIWYELDLAALAADEAFARIDAH
ncbi:twitching motility protein PilI [Aquabacterium commune]|uniref:Twitching motility protein PilI n=2 Tax=Aquabacterium commune TaxID=70586 RepID=A0A4R6RNT0_9BURK|nr:chemotaxis protein CheW [Aquabacterium commune]TDP88252.1 twitching motility protein PilI [Aquabacterium commune]